MFINIRLALASRLELKPWKAAGVCSVGLGQSVALARRSIGNQIQESPMWKSKLWKLQSSNLILSTSEGLIAISHNQIRHEQRTIEL
jgi:hypothetical protein